MLYQPMPLGRRAEPFNHPDWLFEIKWDGFRSLAYIENGHCKLMSRNGSEFKSFPALNSALPLECRARRAVLDGEIVCQERSCSNRDDEFFKPSVEGRWASCCLGGKGDLSNAGMCKKAYLIS